MRPPAEQLIRDYLNRLSVAARNQLQPEDRRAFLARTGDFIERQSGVRGTADPAEVMRILAGLGEPEAVVERERARLEVRRSERAAAASKVTLWKPRRPGPAPAGNDRSGGNQDGDAAIANLTRKDGRPVTGEIKVTSRPITSRWRPGEPFKPRPSRAGAGAAGAGAAGVGGAAGAGAAGAAGAGAPAAAGGAGAGAAGGAGAGAAGAAGAGAPAAAGGAGAGAAGAAGASAAGVSGAAGVGAPGGTGAVAGAGPVGALGAAGVAGAGPAGAAGGAMAGATSPGPAGAQAAPASPPVQGPPVQGSPVQGSPGQHTPIQGTPVQGSPGQGSPVQGSPAQGTPVPGAPAPGGPVRAVPPAGTAPGPVPGPAAGRGGTPASAAAMPITNWRTPRRLPRPQRLQPGDLTRDIARRAAEVGRRHRLETISVVLMVIAGLIYPWPIWLAGFVLWLAGVGIALGSTLWRLPDKWIGLAGPVALVIIGIAVAVSLGGKLATVPDYVHEALGDSVWLIKLGALLGAGYLAWRIYRGRRAPSVPPWVRRNSR